MKYLKVIPVPNEKGNAELIFAEVSNPKTTYFVTVQRRGHTESHLGNNGWQVSENTFQLSARVENDQLFIRVGPKVVAYMEGGSNYQFSVGESELNKLSHSVPWRGVPEFRFPKMTDGGLEDAPKPIDIEIKDEPTVSDPISIIQIETPPPPPPGSGPIKVTCPNGHLVLSTFKKCPTCQAAITPGQVMASGVSSTVINPSIQSAPIQPTPIQPQMITPTRASVNTSNAPATPTSGVSKTFCGNCGKPVLSTMIKCPNCGQPTGTTPSVGGVNYPQGNSSSTKMTSTVGNTYTPQFNYVAPGNFELASRWARLFASIIDNNIIGIIILVLIIKIGFEVELSDLLSDDPLDPEGDIAAFGTAGLIQFVVMILYHTILNATDDSGTFGKMICGIRVRDMQGQRISFWTSLFRSIFTYLPLFSIGMLFIFFTEKKQTMADKICKTMVIKKEQL